MIPNMDEATISDMLQMIREWRAMKATGGRARPGGDFQPVVDAPIYVHNAYAGEIPPAACMQVTGVEKIGQINYYVVDRPADTDGSSGWYLFNRFKAIPEGGMGIAQRGVELLAFKDSGDSTSRDAGDLWGPVANQFYLAESSSGPFVMAGDDDRITDGLRVLLKGGSGEAGMFVMLEDMPTGHGQKARSRLYDWSQNITATIDLYNWGKPSTGAGGAFLDGVRAGYWGSAVLDQGRWRFDFGPCVDDFICATSGSLSGDPIDGQQGVAYSFGLTVSGLNNDIAIDGLPSGLSVNATTGNITGTPTENGEFELIITATADATVGDGTCTLTIVRYLTIDPP